MTYTISNFAKKFGLQTSTVRYYEDEGLLAPHRTANNRRVYHDDDVAWMTMLLHLKASGMSIEEIRSFIHLRAQGNSTLDAQRAIVRTRRDAVQRQIDALVAQRDQLNAKLTDFDTYDANNRLVISHEPFRQYLQRLTRLDQ